MSKVQRKGRKGLQWCSPGLVMTAKRGMFLYMQPCLMTDLEGIVAVAVPIGDLLGLESHLGSLFASPSRPRRPFPWIPEGIDVIMTCMDLIVRDPENILGPVATLKLNSEKGRQHLSTEVLVDLLNSGVWDMAILPCEQAPYGDKACGSKRCRRSVQESQYFAHRIERQHGVPLFANLQGGSCKVSREHATQDLIHERYIGYYLGGFETHTIKEADAEALKPSNKYSVLSESVKQLSTSKPLYIGFDGTCAEIIMAVMAGIDMIQIGLPSVLAKLGLQLNFEIDDGAQENIPGPVNLNETELEASILEKLDRSEIVDVPVRQLVDPKYRADMTPFTTLSRETGPWKGFGAGYSKAYVHHLLNVRESLGHQLLEWHNWRLMIDWFQKLQSFNDRLSLLAYLDWFVDKNMINVSSEIHDSLEKWNYSPFKYEMPKQYVAYDT